jgi:hypothetical protein
MTLEKLYLRQIGLFEVGKFAKKPYFRGFAVVPKEPHPNLFWLNSCFGELSKQQREERS